MRRTFSGRFAAVLALSGAAVIALLGADAGSKPAPARATAPAERGKYLVTIMACNDCHTPWKMGPGGVPEADMTRMLSGHPESLKMPPVPAPSGPWLWSGAATNTAFGGPWGISYAANLTPDRNTGLGIWTEEIFVKALRTGKHYGTSRMIQPPMPWPALAQATDADLKAIFAYLRSIPAIVNHVPDFVEPPAAPAPAKKR